MSKKINLLDFKNKKNSSSRSKFKNKKIKVDNIVFDSKLEANRYIELKSMEKEGVISNLELQKKFPIIVNNMYITSYIADFVYNNIEKNHVIEDAKGFKTREYKMKKNLVYALYGFEIKEIYSKRK